MIDHNYGAGTQRSEILRHLLGGVRLDWMDCLALSGTSKASTRIGEIRRSTGLVIQSEMVSRNGKRFKEYWIDFSKMTKQQNRKYGVK
jgi:hypothetical protein